MPALGTNFSRSMIFELSTSSAFSSSAVKVTNSPRAYSYPLTTSRLSISSPVAGSCGRSVTRVAARLWSPSETGAGRDLHPAALVRDGFSQNRHPHRMLGLVELEEWSNRIEAGRVIRQSRDQLQRSR